MPRLDGSQERLVIQPAAGSQDPPRPLGTQRPALGSTPRSPHNARATLSDSGFSQTGSKARPFFRIAGRFHHRTQKSHRLVGKGLAYGPGSGHRFSTLGCAKC